MIYESYKKTDYLDDVSFIAGTDFKLIFPMYDAYGNQVNASSWKMEWLLSPYGQPEYPILQIEGVLSGSSTFEVEIEDKDTIALGGLYLQQIKITDVAGKTARPGQGIVIIQKAIPSEE